MHRIMLAAALAIGITTALDVSGYTMFSALPLIPLFLLFSWVDRLSPKSIGLSLGSPEDYGYAVAHPLLVLGVIAMAAQSFGAIDLSAFEPAKVLLNIAILAGATFVMAIITEEGFFRGYLWAGASKQGVPPLLTLVFTTAVFVLWHAPFAFLSGEFAFGTAQIPLFFVNVALLGLIWGLLRLGSGSILVPSLGHGIWNGLVYVLFGVGSNVGALGIRDVGLYGPEVGVLGALLNLLVAATLAWMFRAQLRPETRAPATSG